MIVAGLSLTAGCTSGDTGAGGPTGVATETPSATATTSTPAATATAGPSASNAQPAWEFPERVGPFTRTNVTRDAKKREAIAEYVDALSRHTITVYVYPTGPTLSIGATASAREAMYELLLRDEFEGSKRAIQVSNPAVRLQSSGATTVQQRGKAQQGHTATYTYTGGLAGQPVDITTVLHIFRDGDWWVKYRTSYGSAAAATASSATTAFIESLHWPPSP